MGTSIPQEIEEKKKKKKKKQKKKTQDDDRVFEMCAVLKSCVVHVWYMYPKLSSQYFYHVCLPLSLSLFQSYPRNIPIIYVSLSLSLFHNISILY